LLKYGLRRLAVPVLTTLALLPAVCDARLYRWVDQEGTVHYTDSLPPDQAARGHAEISDKGVVVGITAPAKTPEELQREQELKRLSDAAQRAKEQQDAADQVLLRSFRSVDDMIMARDGKLSSIDVMLQVARSNIRRQQEGLRGLRAEAADLERAGKPIPSQLNDGITAAEKSIADAYSAILSREQHRRQIYTTFASDLQRFLELKDARQAREVRPAEPPPGTDMAIRNAITCADSQTCDRLWERATAYVRARAATPTLTSGPNVLLTAPPRGDDDLGITLARIPDKEGQGATLFLDIQCKPSPKGDTTCTSPAAQAILDGFKAGVVGVGGGG